MMMNTTSSYNRLTLRIVFLQEHLQQTYILVNVFSQVLLYYMNLNNIQI